MKNIVLSVSSRVSYEELDSIVSPLLTAMLKDVKIKRSSDVHAIDMVIENPGERVSSRQSLLKEYLSKRFPEEYVNYYALLEESQIM